MKLVSYLKYLVDKFNSSPTEDSIPIDLKTETTFLNFYHQCQPFTLTRIERQYSLYQAVIYLEKHKIPGAYVECGVYKGGSTMMAALTLKHLNRTKRPFFLYDTYQGMTKPSTQDIDIHGEPAMVTWKKLRQGNFSSWAKAPLDEVKQNMALTKYPQSKFKYIIGKVEDTIPKIIPDRIALLRLDTDWYTSTKHELIHLYPKLVPGGILIIDDYGHFSGAKKAVDEYFKEIKSVVFLHRIDYTARLIIKPLQ